MKSIVNWGKMILGDQSGGKKIIFNCVTIDDVTGKISEGKSPFVHDQK